MFIYAVAVLALMLTVSTAVLEMAILTAKAAASHRLAVYLQMGYDRAVSDVQSALAATVTIDTRDGLAKAPPDVAALANLKETPIAVGPDQIADTVTVTSAIGTSGADVAQSQQPAQPVNEGRLSLRITVTVTNAARQLAQRTTFVTLRLFAQAPYSAVAGVKDETASDPGYTYGNTHEGDSGGQPGIAAPTPNVVPPTGIGDTRYYVKFTCIPTNRYDCGYSNPNGQNFANMNWKNGNGTGIGGWPP
jgi:hypothetical protein